MHLFHIEYEYCDLCVTTFVAHLLRKILYLLRGATAMYIGGGTVLLILIVVLIVFLARR